MVTKSIQVKINKCIEITKCLKKHKETGHSFHATFIYDKNKLLSIGFNNYKKLHRSHKFGIYKGYKDNPEKYVASIHSEIDALIKLGRTNCSKLTFINIRIDNNGNPNIAKPCSNCLKVLQDVGFKNIYFTNLNKIEVMA
jgi:deoxycytidylate deaminase